MYAKARIECMKSIGVAQQREGATYKYQDEDDSHEFISILLTFTHPALLYVNFLNCNQVVSLLS
jgi:hypothetical protein